MPTIMIPRRLWKRFGLPGEPGIQPNDPTSRLGNWALASIPTGLGDLALFMNQRTCLTIVTPLVPLAPLFACFSSRLADALDVEGVPQEVIRTELLVLAEALLGKNMDRSLLGTTNDLVGHAQFRARLATTPEKACDLIQSELNQMPHVNRRPPFPRQALAQVLATRH